MKKQLLYYHLSKFQYILFGALLSMFLSPRVNAAPIANAPFQDARPLSVTGTVRAADGEMLPGVSILLKGTSTGTVTDVEGRYSIHAPENGTLVFSSIGYTLQETPVTGRSVINVTLAEDVHSLQEVVVVGYGTQKKSDLTGSISSISGNEVTLLPTQRVDQALQGRAAGVMVLNTDGAPGGNTTIRVRGMNSINGGNNALIVIDGLQGADLNSINPNDIESIEVLKDASATAIYGSQGANGVILITTKMGKTGKPVISYTYDMGASQQNKKYDLLSAAEYARNINAVVLSRNGDRITPQPIFSEAEIEEFERTGGTDWQDVIYRTAKIQNHQLSLSGANDKVNYLLSGGYLDQEGILLNTSYKRFTLRANVETEINKWAVFGLNWAGSKEITNSTLFGGSTDWPNNPVGAALRFSPTIPVYDENGNYSKGSLFYGNPILWNPLASAVEPLLEGNTFRNNLNSYLQFQLMKGLTLRVTGGARLTEQDNVRFLNNKTFIGLQNNGQGTTTTNSTTYLQNSNILTYDKTIDQHHLTVTAVAEQQYTKSAGANISTTDFLNKQTGAYDLAGANISNVGSFLSERRINSYLGRVNYIFNDRYLITASYRADGSSVFGKNNKWGYFPSASVAWRAANESFVSDLNVFSDLKFRASWGVTGNQAISPYQTLARINSGANYPYNGGDGTDIGFQITAAENPSLRWETTTQTDFGIDVGILNGRLNITADYYIKTTEDLLMPRELPLHTGLRSIIDNVGSMQNKGIEIAVDGDPLVGTLAWNTGFNISANRTTVLDVGPVGKIAFTAGGSGQGTNLPFMYLVTDEPFGQMMGWGYEGTWKQDEADLAATYGQLPGDPHYTDVNKDGKIDIQDQKVIGNSMPKFIFGWNNRLTYRNFELMLQIQGVQGNNIFNVARIALEEQQGTSRRLLDRWTPDNKDSDIPALIDGLTRQNANLTSTISFPTSSGNTNSRWVEDGSYVRLKNITVAYNFPKALTDKINLNNLRLYVSGTNLVTITNYLGYDPEVSSYTGNDAQIGTDYNNYPQSKLFNVGVNLSF
jgi:TonB-linked SusC/RagA family outer membrane protein